MALSGQRHSADVALPNDVVIEKRSSRMALHSVIHCLPTLLFRKFGAVAKLAGNMCMPHTLTMVRTAPGPNFCTIRGLDLHKVLRRALLGHKCCAELST